MKLDQKITARLLLHRSFLQRMGYKVYAAPAAGTSVNETITLATTPTSPTNAAMAGYLSYLVKRHLPRNLHRGRSIESGHGSIDFRTARPRIFIE
jgi:hypothetical protein